MTRARSASLVLLLVAACFASGIPKNTKLEIRLDETLSSDTCYSGQKFLATLNRPVSLGSTIALSRGARVEGLVRNAESTFNYNRPGELDLELTSVTSDGKTYSLRTSLMVLAGKPSPIDPATGRPIDRGSRQAGAARSTIDAVTGGSRGTSQTIPGTDISVGTTAERTGMQVVLPAKSKLTFNLTSASAVNQGD